MKNRLFAWLLCLLLAVSILPFTTLAATSRLDDRANLLSSAEKNRVEKTLDEISAKFNVDIVIVTVNFISGFTADSYAENYYDSNGIGTGTGKDGALLLVCMAEREYRILSNGMVGDAIDDDAIDSICDEIVDDLSDGDYEEAFLTFARECDYYIDGHLNGFPFPALETLLICLGVGLVIALIVTCIMASRLKSVRQKQGAGEYTKPGSMQVTHASDLFLYRNVTRVKIQTNNTSGSSGGSRHIGGGKF